MISSISACISRRTPTRLMYTLAGLDNAKLGWGRQDETWSFMETLSALGGEDWFRLGDRDLAVHVERTRRLRRGESLSAITADFCRRLGVGPRVLPATDDRLRTRLRTDEGWLDFQDYFVRLQCRPVVRELAFDGADGCAPSSGPSGGVARRTAARGDHLPVQPLHQRRADPRRAGDACRRFPPARRPSSRFLPSLADARSKVRPPK